MISTLLILIPGFAKDENDSTCIPFSQSLIKTINKLHPGLEVIIIPLDFPFTSKEYTWFGNRVIPLNGSASSRPFLWLRLYRLLKKITKTKKHTGILNLWCADNALVSHYFSKRHKVVQYTWLQGQDARKGNKALLFFNPCKENLIALSDSLKAEFHRNYSIAPQSTIYPGIEPSLFANADKVKKDIDIIGVGSLTPLKQYNIFIDVIAELKRHFPFIRTMLIGKGPEESLLRKMITERDLEHNIELKGEQDHEQAIQLMMRSKILLHPSSYEGYSIACLEGLAAGCQVVSFVSPEAQPIQGWTVTATKAEMVNAAFEILQLPDVSFQQVNRYTMDDCVTNILRLYGIAENQIIQFHDQRVLMAE